MAIGTTIDYPITGALIVQDAAELLNAVEAGLELTSAQKTSCLRTLNMMIKTWDADGATRHTDTLAYLFPVASTYSYPLDTSKYTYAYTRTTLSAAAAVGTTIVVTSATGITNAYTIGVYQSDGTMHWTTVNGAPVGTTVTLTDTLTAAADSGAIVYCFSATPAGRPLEIKNAWLRTAEQNDTPIDVVSVNEFMDQAAKTSTGQINQISYDAQTTVSSLHLPRIYTWPTPEDPRQIVVMMVRRTVYDFDADTENPDFPQESYLALVYNLAVLIAPKLGTPANVQMLIPMAQSFYSTYKDHVGKPDGAVRFELDMEG